jgi:carbamate kinase
MRAVVTGWGGIGVVYRPDEKRYGASEDAAVDAAAAAAVAGAEVEAEVLVALAMAM